MMRTMAPRDLGGEVVLELCADDTGVACVDESVSDAVLVPDSVRPSLRTSFLTIQSSQCVVCENVP